MPTTTIISIIIIIIMMHQVTSSSLCDVCVLCRYTQNGLLQMLERNLRIKEAPERFQDSSDKFDLIITCEERCYDIVCEGNAHLSSFSLT